jgi:acetyl-CoA carboxylase biotin carboxylase subunit
MGEAAIRAARAAGYYNAGTVEFLVDADRNFYFLEMNTRLQVEHPVTEMATGLDLVRLQVEVAAGSRLNLRQEDIRWRGWAVECRIYAEDPWNNFYPCPGTITQVGRPLGPGVRIDGYIYEGWTVPMEYDPLLAKLAVWAATRDDAIARAVRALREYEVGGIVTNIGFFRQIFEDPDYRAGCLHTSFIDEFLGRTEKAAEPPALEPVAALAATLYIREGEPARDHGGAAQSSPWLAAGRGELLR